MEVVDCLLLKTLGVSITETYMEPGNKTGSVAAKLHGFSALGQEDVEDLPDPILLLMNTDFVKEIAIVARD